MKSKAFIFLLWLSLVLVAAARPVSHPPPVRLAVLLVFDQFRADYLTRFERYLLPVMLPNGKVGGYRYLMEKGANFVDCRFDHYPLVTAVGHAVISTGGEPYKTRIVGNEWYDPAEKKTIPSIWDKEYRKSPRNLASTTIGDELRLATGQKSKVVALSLKDRAAILLGGHTANTVVWFDTATGNWVTSRFYGNEAPEWVKKINVGKWVDKKFGTVWEKLLPDAAYEISARETPHVSAGHSLGSSFPHPITGGLKNPGPQYYEALTLSPLGNELTFKMALEAVKAEGLGQDGFPDLLALNFASNDYVGHAFGPFSPEVEDLTLRTDRMLSDFLNRLNSLVPGGLHSVLIAATADHGVSGIPEYLRALRIEAVRQTVEQTQKTVEEALVKSFGPGPWVAAFVPPYVYLNSETIARSGKSEETVEREAVQALLQEPWVEAVFGRTQILSGGLPSNEIGQAVARSFVPGRSGNLIIVPRIHAAWYYSEKGAMHISPYPYDNHVPLLLAGPGIHPGIYGERVGPKDLAPTLAYLLRTQFPAACEGRILAEALK